MCYFLAKAKSGWVAQPTAASVRMFVHDKHSAWLIGLERVHCVKQRGPQDQISERFLLNVFVNENRGSIVLICFLGNPISIPRTNFVIKTI